MNTEEGFTINDKNMDNMVNKLKLKGTKHLEPSRSNVKIIVLSKKTTDTVYNDQLSKKIKEMDKAYGYDSTLLFSKSNDSANKMTSSISNVTLNNGELVILESNPAYIPEDPTSLYRANSRPTYETRVRQIIKSVTKPEKIEKKNMDDVKQKANDLNNESNHAKQMRRERERRKELERERERSREVESQREMERQEELTTEPSNQNKNGIVNNAQKGINDARKGIRKFFKR